MMKLNCYLQTPTIRCVQEFTVEALKNTVWRSTVFFTVTRNDHKLGPIEARFIPMNYEVGQRSQDLEPPFLKMDCFILQKLSFIK
jgi:hypothetical protein